MRRALLVFAAAALVAGVAATTAAANHSWGNYHWARTANPFTVKNIDSMTSNWDAYLDTAESDWTASSVLDVLSEAGADDRNTRKRCPAVTGKIRTCNAEYGNNGWLGLASINVSGSHITRGTAKMNDTYFNTATYNTPAWKLLVVCQEVAHDFGLGHQDETFDNVNLGSCMDYTNDPDGGAGGASSTDPSNEHPNGHDFDQLETIYNNHLDSSTTLGMSTNDKAKPSKVERTDRISDSTIVEHYADGSKRITHILWAIGSPRMHFHHDDH